MLVAIAIAIGLTIVVASPASAVTPSGIAALAQANVGKGAGSCSVTNSSPNSLGGASFYSSCSGNGGQGEYWCADFLKWVWANNGVNVTGITAAAGSVAGNAAQNGSTVHTDGSYRPQLGDAAVFDWNGGGYADHVGVVTQVNTDGSIRVANGDFNGSGNTQGEFARSALVVSATINAANAHPGGSAFSMTLSVFVTPNGLDGGSGGTVAPQPNTYPTLGSANIRAAATTSAPVINTVAQGTELTIDCYVNGESVSGTTIWDHVASGGYVSDSLLYTGTNNPVVSACSTPTNTYPTFENASVRILSSELASAISSAPAGTQLTIDCYVIGELVEGTTIWDHVSSGGFVSDSHLLTGSDSAVVPSCPAGILHGPFPTFEAGTAYSQPSTSSATLATYPVGQYLTVDCYLDGESVDGTTIWDHILGLGFISDSVVLTGSASPVVPQCQLSQLAPVPGIVGNAVVGSTLSVSAGEWAPAPVTLSYSWLANGIATGATGTTYLIPTSAIGKSISVAVTGSASGLAGYTVTSGASAIVVANVNIATATPTITGTARVGSTLTANPGVWPAPVTPTYRWFASGHVIANATAASLVLATALVGKTISVEVTRPTSGGGTSVLTSASTSPVGPWVPAVSRISGTDRYSTAVAVAHAGFPTTAPVVYVATGSNFPDALGAAAAAAKLGGPLLLTAPSALPASVATEIQSLHPGKVVIVGGTSVVTDNVANSISALVLPWSGVVTRIAGADRYATARLIVQDAFGAHVTSAFIATGQNYPDALGASAAAGAKGIPVILVNGGGAGLDIATKTFLQSLGTTSFRIAGGTSAVSTGIADDLATLGTVTRYAGANRYETSEIISAALFTSHSSAYFATGSGFTDALAGAALAGFKKTPLYVVEPTCVPVSTGNDLSNNLTSKVTLIGGVNALSSGVFNLTAC